ncbi:MAG: peptide ABC transporter permease [Rhodobacterales bacterium RIFCSPHIGHO2_02_FULL_62_130]|nr:MAG: peptide ABC transporter permease [Rhodobacterales bacterium RIFCSPHIGHO2_02_FULL_62_130]OHC60098.1 MAG: peptide ABC transporter permease [Rhodobacterales bacterium RIFCSPHIGHO2_12_FULL_62_75]
MSQKTDLGRPLEGVLWMLASGLSFVGVNGIVRYLGTDLPAAQSAFIRFGFGVLFLLPVMPSMFRVGFAPGAMRLFAGRGVVHLAAVLFWFYAMARIPVADVTAIGYLNPVVLLLAGSLLLGETLTPRRVIALALALLGAVIVLRPGLRALQLGHLSQIGAALCFAGSYLFAKRLTALAPASVVVAMLSLTVTAGLAPIAALVWVPVTWAQTGWLAVVAALATLGHYLMTRAFRAAPFSVTQPVTFLQLVWASLLGATAFGEPVDGYVLLGGAIIIGAISWVSWRDAAAG